MTFPNENMRPIQYPLNRSQGLVGDTDTNETIDTPFKWSTTDNDERISITLTLSLNEYVALASAIDVGRDIAYGGASMAIWWIWVRSVNPMSFCEQVNDCIDTNITTQLAINNTLLSNGIVNPDQIQPFTPQMDNRFPEALRNTDSAPPPPTCDKDALWTGILEIVTRINLMGLDFLERVVSENDKAERIANIIDIVPLFGDVAADVITIFADVAQDIENGYVAHSSQQVLEETACKLFEIVCEECRYPTFDEIYDHYANFGITGIDDIANISITALIDYLIGTSGLANAVIWYSMQCVVLFTLYLGGTFANKRGTKWLAIWADIGEDAPSNGWELLCDGCADEWCYRFDFKTGLDGWTIEHGTQGINGIENTNYQSGGNYFSGSWINLDFLGKTNITTMRMYSNWVDTAIQNSVAFVWMKRLDGDLSGAHLDVAGGGYNGAGQIRDVTIDVSTWGGAKVQTNSAARADDPYVGNAESYIQFVELRGTGINPFGVSPCSP